MIRIIGKTIGNYRITEEIGHGGMGRVYKGIHMTLDRVAAIKMINPRLLGDPEVINRFYKEAKIQAQLNHPNIVTVYDFLEVESGYFIVMEYVHGESLGKILWKHGPLGTPVAISVFKQILDGIGYAHSKGVIHRDIKPNNFLLTPSLVKISDFGIAQIICDTGLNANEGVVGTPKYMSPEQILGEKTDHRSDIYSLGITLYEMLTGRVPFGSDSDTDYGIKRGHIELPPPSLSRIKPDIPGELENIVFRALAKRPEERFQSIDEFFLALEKLKDSKKDSLTRDLESLHLFENDSIKGPEGGPAEEPYSEEEYEEIGMLSSTSYPNLLLSIYREKKSGFLVVDSEIKLKIYFREGVIVFVEGEDYRLTLGEILVSKAKITKADREKALSFAHDTGLKIGEALIKLGKITPHELNSTLESQLREKLISGFKCEVGFYGFKHTSNFNFEATYKINPIQVIYDGVSRIIKNGQIPHNSFYDMNSSIIPCSDMGEGLKKLIFNSPRELKLANLLREELTLKSIISASPLNASDTLRFLYFLYLAGLVEIPSKNAPPKNTKQPKDITLTYDKTQILTEQEIERLTEQASLRERLRKH